MANFITSMPTNDSLAYEVYIKPLFENPKINALPFDVVVGKVGKDLYFNSPFNSFPSLKTSCGWDFVAGAEFVKKTLNPVELQLSVEQCYTELLKSIYGDSLPDGWQKGELTSEIIDFIVTQQLSQFNYGLLLRTFLADTAQSEAWLAGNNGVYAQLLEGVANNDGTVDAGTITDNDLLPANIEATMYKIYEAQSDYLSQMDDSQKVLIVTNSIAKAWKRYLQTQTGLNTIIQTSYMTDGINTLSYNSIPFYVVDFVDRGLKLFDLSGSPLAVNNPHRAILTVGSNHKIMIDGSGFERAEPWYEKKDDKVYSAASAMVDYAYGFGDLNVIAGF